MALRRALASRPAWIARGATAAATAPAATPPTHFPGAPDAPFATEPAFLRPEQLPLAPTYRLTAPSGAPLTDRDPGQLAGKELALQFHKCMLKTSVMDNVLYTAQRQGRFAFYMTSTGEEAAVIGAAAALDSADEVFAQYREQGLLMWRGFTYSDFTDQCTGNDRGNGKGRQMPVHYLSKKLHYQTISSPLATQIPHAVGAAYALKGTGRIAVAFFGEGAASEGDFHTALNFAATLECPVLFLCRNNGYAISTPVGEQYRGDGIVGRGPGYGITSLRVDGSDFWAVYDAVQRARSEILEKNRPMLLELMCYREGHHSTSDDSSRYRGKDEIAAYTEAFNPIVRMRRYLEAKGWWDAEQEKRFLQEERNLVLRALEESETVPKHPPHSMFDDVYDEMNPILQKQLEESLLDVETSSR